jgi:hypothetical protein
MLKQVPYLMVLILLACEIPEQIYEDPLDLDYNAGLGIYPPALIFSPDQLTVNSGTNTTLKVYALEVNKVAGAHVQIKYDKNKVQLSSVSQGDWLVDGGQNPVFFFQNDAANGTLDIYYSVLGDSENLSGSGVVAYTIFNISAPGESTIQITNATKIVDKDNQEIQLNGLGEVVINAQ